jgi:predicted acyl esterase
MLRRLIGGGIACLVLACGGTAGLAAPAKNTFTKTDVTITATDGVKLASTLYTPDGTPPAGGWPAIVLFHGIGGKRADVNPIAEQTFAPEGYVVLTIDHRGHGESGGLFNVDGPREVADAKDIYDWLAARSNVDKAHIGAWGISLGGGLIWNALKAGVPFAAAEVVETWVDLYRALAPNNLVKTGAAFQFLSSVPAERTDPELNAIKSDALNGTNVAALRAYADARSVHTSLAQIKTPVFVFQGRRDFAFGLEQGFTAYRQLGGPKRIYIGDFGHAPSTFPGPDAALVFANGSEWFARYLKSQPTTTRQPVEVAPDPFSGGSSHFGALPATKTVTTKTLKPNKTFGARGKLVLTYALPKQKLEVFGAPTVVVQASTKTQAKQLVAVVESVAPNKTTAIISEGGVLLPTGRKAWKLSFPLIWDTALIARGSKLRVTLAWTTLAHDPANLLYLTGVPDGSTLTIKSAFLKLPVLKAAVS